MINHIGSRTFKLTTCQTFHMRREYMRLWQRIKTICPYNYMDIPRLIWLKELFIMLETKNLATQFVNNSIHDIGLTNIFRMKELRDLFTLEAIGFFEWATTVEGWDFWNRFSAYAIDIWNIAYSCQDESHVVLRILKE